MSRSKRSGSVSYFYPRPPRGGRLLTPKGGNRRAHFYPRPPRGGRHAGPDALLDLGDISIHALREEGDKTVDLLIVDDLDFYPRPPRGGRPESVDATVEAIKFLSTPSARRATPPGRRDTAGHWNFYPRPPRGGRHTVSISSSSSFLFLSTPSARRATKTDDRAAFQQMIFLSTPSARRATTYAEKARTAIDDFYPRPPRGGRLEHLQSNLEDSYISIHALREEGDSAAPPSEGRGIISIHALREEGDFVPIPISGIEEEFLSTPSARRATCAACASICRRGNFYPRPPRGGRR